MPPAFTALWSSSDTSGAHCKWFHSGQGSAWVLGDELCHPAWILCSSISQATGPRQTSLCISDPWDPMTPLNIRQLLVDLINHFFFFKHFPDALTQMSGHLEIWPISDLFRYLVMLAHYSCFQHTNYKN